MSIQKQNRRLISITLIITGAVLMFLAPESWPVGAVIFIFGFLLDMVGLVLDRRKDQQP